MASANREMPDQMEDHIIRIVRHEGKPVRKPIPQDGGRTQSFKRPQFYIARKG